MEKQCNANLVPIFRKGTSGHDKVKMKVSTQKNWDKEKISAISKYLSFGFTTPEIAEKMGLHRVTIQRHKTELKRRYKEKAKP